MFPAYMVAAVQMAMGSSEVAKARGEGRPRSRMPPSRASGMPATAVTSCGGQGGGPPPALLGCVYCSGLFLALTALFTPRVLES